MAPKGVIRFWRANAYCIRYKEFYLLFVCFSLFRSTYARNQQFIKQSPFLLGKHCFFREIFSVVFLNIVSVWYTMIKQDNLSVKILLRVFFLKGVNVLRRFSRTLNLFLYCIYNNEKCIILNQFFSYDNVRHHLTWMSVFEFYV